MSLIYTRHLGQLAPSSAAVWSEIFRAPSSGTVVVRDLLIVNPTTAAISEAAIRDRPLSRAGEAWWWYAKPLAQGTVHYELRQVLPAGHALEFYGAEGGVYVTVTGYVFES